MPKDLYEFHVAKSYAIALINADYSGFEYSEIKMLEAFEAKVVDLVGNARFVVAGSLDDENFGTCEACNKFADCAELHVFED